MVGGPGSLPPKPKLQKVEAPKLIAKPAPKPVEKKVEAKPVAKPVAKPAPKKEVEKKEDWEMPPAISHEIKLSEEWVSRITQHTDHPTTLEVVWTSISKMKLKLEVSYIFLNKCKK